MAEGLTFGKVVKGAALITGAALAVAITGDNIDGMFDGITESPDHFTDTIGDGFAWAGEKSAIGVDKITELAGADPSAYTPADLQSSGIGDDVGAWDALRDAGANVGGEVKDTVMAIPENASHVLDEHKTALATSAVVAGAGTLALTNRSRGKHTAAVNAERGNSSTIESVASGAGTAARRTAGLGADLIKTGANTVGGVASSVNRAVRG